MIDAWTFAGNVQYFTNSIYSRILKESSRQTRVLRKDRRPMINSFIKSTAQKKAQAYIKYITCGKISILSREQGRTRRFRPVTNY